MQVNKGKKDNPVHTVFSSQSDCRCPLWYSYFFSIHTKTTEENHKKKTTTDMFVTPVWTCSFVCFSVRIFVAYIGYLESGQIENFLENYFYEKAAVVHESIMKVECQKYSLRFCSTGKRHEAETSKTFNLWLNIYQLLNCNEDMWTVIQCRSFNRKLTKN